MPQLQLQLLRVLLLAHGVVPTLEKLLMLMLHIMTGASTCATDRTLDRDFFMSAEEAKCWGLIDEIVTPRTPASVAEPGAAS